MTQLELNFICWTLAGLVGLLLAIIGYFGKKADKHLEKIADSVNDLKIEVTKLVTKHDGLEKRVEKLEDAA
jgi:hypothetical protein